jgi:hypothetical protein
VPSCVSSYSEMAKSKSRLLTTKSSRPEKRPLNSVACENESLTSSMPLDASIAVSATPPPAKEEAAEVRLTIHGSHSTVMPPSVLVAVTSRWRAARP